MKKLLTLLVLVCLTVTGAWGDEAFRKHRYDSWKVMGLPENAVVFAGNSITDMHNWVEAFGNDQRIVNRGNSGGYSFEVLDNVESWVRFKPAKVFIKIGTNDLGTSYTEQSIADNIQKTVDIIRNESPDTKIYLQSILPAKDQAYKTLTTIQAANVLIKAIADATTNCTYIDLYSQLGGIRSGGSYSADNLHLKAYGYKIWCEAILPYLNEGNTGATFSCVYPSNTETVQNMGGLSGSHGMRATYFSVQPITSSDILFFGDEMVKNGEWNELLKNSNIKNRGTGWGYGGDIATTSGIIDATFANTGVSKAAPSKILLYTGTGDVNGNTALNTVESNYEALITKLQTKAPGTPIYLVSLMPRSSANTRITDFNTWLQSKANGSSIYYIDIYTTLASGGKANGNYFSGDYIYGMGYVKVAQELAKHIEGCTTLTDAQATDNKAVFEARTALNTAVNKAKSINVGTEIGQYPQSVANTLASAITTAYGVLANTDATVSALNAATTTFNSTLNTQLANINKPATNKNYTIKASFSSGANGRYLVNNNGTLSAYTYLPGGYSALWTYTGSGFKSAADPTEYLYVNGGFKLATSTHTLNINVGLTEGTVGIAEDTRYGAINKNGTVAGGQYTGKQQNENDGWTTDFILEEVEGEIPAPEVSAPTFSAVNLLNTQTGWYQIADYMNASGTATSDPGLLTAYADEVTVNSNKYPAGFSVKKTATSVDDLAKTFVYVTKTGSNNTNTNYINVQTANGRYMTYDGTSSLTASQIYQIYFTGSQPTRIVMSSSNQNSSTRHSWIPQTSNAVNYVGYATNGQFPSYQFSAVDLDALNLKTYTVKAVGVAGDVQVTYNGTDNYGIDKVYNNGVFFFGIDAYPTAADFTCSVANATITVGDGVIYVDGAPSTTVFETPTSGTPYRIPAVAQAKNGDLVFVSDYRYSKADIGMANNGKLDLRFRKKYADGHWGDVKTLAACIESPTFTAFGDPCIVCDQTTGKIMVTSCCGNVSYPNGTHSNHQGWSRWYSEDNGETWSNTYVDLSEQVMNQIDKRTGAKLASFFIGSGKISQSKTVKVGDYYRLYCASLTRVSPDGTGTNAQTMNYVWYSDDFGVTWNMLGTPDQNPINGGNEPKADELPDGSVLISSRTGGGRIYNIYHYTDTNAAKGSWGSQVNSNASNNGTYGADCNGEILVVPVTRAADNQKTYLLLQSIPAASDRRNVGIYWKELTDLSKYRTAAELAANNWTLFPISTTTSAYSTMCQMKNDHIAFFYEENDHNSGYDMVFKEFSIEAITGNAYTFSELSESEKNTYLTNGVDPYFNTHSYGDENIISLAAAYKTSPTVANYNALNAAVQEHFDLNVAGEYIRLRNCNYNTYMNANGTGINGINDGTGTGTLWYVEDNGEGGLKLKNVGTGTYMGNISQSKAVTLSADNTTTFEFEMLDNGHVVFKQQNGGNYQYGHIDGSNKLVGWEKSASATQWELTEVVEIPSSAFSLETDTEVTAGELADLTITFKGANKAKVKLNADSEMQKAYLVKDESPAQTKAQSKFNAPRLKAAGEVPAGAIEGTITGDAGEFSIDFGDAAIDNGAYTLTIPAGTFYVENDQSLNAPVPALKANYTVGEETAPVDDISVVTGSTTDGFTEGYYLIQVGSEGSNGYSNYHDTYRGWYICGIPTSSGWAMTLTQDVSLHNYVYLTKSGDSFQMEFLHGNDNLAYKPGSDCKKSTTNKNLTISPYVEEETNSLWKIWGEGSKRWMAWDLDGEPAVGSTNQNNALYNTCTWKFTKVDDVPQTPVAGKVYTIQAVFPTAKSADLYLTNNGNDALQFTETAVPVKNYWVARATGNDNRPFSFQSGYGDGRYLDGNGNNGLSTVGTNVAVSQTMYGFHMQAELTGKGTRYIGSWKAEHDPGFGIWGGSFGQNDNYGDWTTHYRLAEVPDVEVYEIVCANEQGGVTPTFEGYAGVNVVRNGGIIIVEEGMELSANNLTAVQIDGYTPSIAVDAANYTITVTYTASEVTLQDRHLYTIKGAFADDVLLPLVRNDNSMKAGAKSATPQTFVFFSTTHENNAGLAPLYKLGTVEGNGYFTYGGGVGNEAVAMAFLTSETELQGDVAWDGTAFKEGYFGMVGVNSTNDYRTYTVKANTNVNYNGRYNKNKIYGSNQLPDTENYSCNYILEEITGYTVYDVVMSGSATGMTYQGTAGNCLTTANQGNGGYLVVKDGATVTASDFAFTGIPSGYQATISINDGAKTITVSSEEIETVVPETGYYYIKENGKYLYNDFLTTDVTQSAATKQTYDNGYVWKVTSTEGSTTVTLLNGEGSGYNSTSPNSIDLSSKNWTFEPFVGHDPVPVFVQYAILGEYVPFQEPWMTYNSLNSVAHNGGFFTFSVSEGEHLDRYGYSTNVIGQPSPDGTNWVAARLFNHSETNHRAAAYYYSQQDLDRYADVVLKTLQVLTQHEGEPGYCIEQNEDFEEEEGTFAMLNYIAWQVYLGIEWEGWTLEEAASTVMEPYEAKYILGKLNDYIKTLEIVPPVQGDAYHIAVRGNDYTGNTRYYLKNDGSYTTNVAEADVFVLGGSGDDTCGSLLVTNNNPGTEGGIHYLQVREDGVQMNTEYDEADNALNLVSMTKAEGDNIDSCPAYLYGTFSATNKDGKVLTFDETGEGSWINDADDLYMKDNKTSAIELIPVEYPYNKPKFAVGSPDDHEGGYASIWLPYPMVFPEGVEAYRATSVENDGILILTQVNEDQNAVAAGGYILRAPEQTTDTDPDNLPLVLPAPASPDDVTPYEDNAFVGSTENPLVEKEEGSWAAFREQHPNGTPYVLGRKNKIVGYYKYIDTEYLPKGKAIWFSNYTGNAECVQFSFDDIISAIEALHGNTGDNEIFDLQGRRLDKAEKGQVNVINGKKVMFK